MKVLQINSVPYGSTCGLMLTIADHGTKQGIQMFTASGFSKHPVVALPQNHIHIGGVLGKSLHIVLSKITGYHGCFSRWSTQRLLQNIEKEEYDILHFHNLHGWYLNFPMLFAYIRERKIPVVWTLHDCWAFTGHCPHFTMIGCERWRTGCFECPQHRLYPGTYLDRSEEMWNLKRQWFTEIPDLTIVTPSQWLADLSRQSFLKDCDTRVIPNGINLAVFKPTESSFRSKHGLNNRKIVLGVAFGWSKRKGLDVFIELAKRLDKTYQIILVGTDNTSESQLPETILTIRRTQNQKEMAEIYSAADVYVNPSREENYPTVNMEAIACGTPVVTFCAGGSPEILDETCGSVVAVDDVDAMQKEVERICENRPYSQSACLRKATEFNASQRANRYLELYKEIYDRTSENRV